MFRKKLNRLKPLSENYNNDIYEITKDASGKPAFQSKATGSVYATTKELAAANPDDRGKREDYSKSDQGMLKLFEIVSYMYLLKAYLTLMIDDFDRLIDFTGPKFEGYLFDTHEPYNMYLRAGIGSK